MSRICTAFLIIVISVLCGVLKLLSEMSADVAIPFEYEEVYRLNLDGEYNVPAVDVPRMSGWGLSVLDYLSNSIPFSTLICRYFAKSAGFFRVEFLANQLPPSSPRLGFPFVRPEQPTRLDDELNEDPNNISPTVQYNSVLHFHEKFLSLESTPSEVLKSSLKHAETVQTEYKPFSEIFNRAELEQLAHASDLRYQQGKSLSVWDGILVAVKDEISIAGHSVLLGRDPSVAFFAESSPEDDPIVAEFKKNGAIFIGITVMHEIANSPLGWNTHFGGPKNAWNSTYMSGGSTGGCGVIVAAGIVPVCIGLDAGGSIRIPAAWNGVFGFAPTFGRILSNSKNIHHFSTLHVGPIAATSIDTALAFKLMASVKVSDHVYNSQFELPPAGTGVRFASKTKAHEYLSSLKIGLFPDWIEANTEQNVLALFNEMVEFLFRDSGKVPFKIPHMFEQQLSHGICFISELSFAHQLSFYHPNELPLEHATRIGLGMATGLSILDLVAAEKVKGWGLKIWQNEWKNFDIVILPTQGVLPYPITSDIYTHGVSDPAFVVQMVTKTFITNLLGYPAISIPIGLVETVDGTAKLPVGLQVICKHWRDEVCLQVANAVETLLESNRTTPPSFRDILA